MRERPEDTGIAVGLSVGIHLAVLLLLYLGWRFAPVAQPLSVAGPPIEVEFGVLPPATAPPRPAPPRPVEPEPAAPPPQPIPEPRPQDAVVERQPAPQTPQAVPDVRDQERAARDAVSPEPPAPREQEERRRQQQVDLTERQRQAEAEERQRRTAQQLERLARLREQREQFDRQTRVDEQRLEQLRDLAQRAPVPAPAPAATTGPVGAIAGNFGTDTGLQAAYSLAIQNAVERHWIRPDTIPPGTPCRLRVIQIPGGDVISAEVIQPCAFDAIGQRSLEAAVLRAEPLPFAGFESVFRRELLFNFRAPD